MALVLKDRVKETTTTTGTGNIALGGAVSNFVTFSSVLSDSDTTYYAIVDSNNSAFEVGLGTYASSGNTIARTTVLASSNSGSAVNLSSGSKVIFCAFPADKAVIEDANGVVSIENLQFDTNAMKATNTNGNVQLTPNGTGFVELVGATNAGTLRFNCESNSHGVTLKGPPHSASATYSLELPNADGSAGQLLKTDGSGKLAFTSSLPGITATASEINILDGVTATASEINILDGVTATTSEINILDGVTATASEINILDGVTATASEINILDGVTATTAELNYVDGVTSNIQTQIDSISPSPTFTATASGALANGDPVILNSDGTVTVVSGRASATGSTTTFESSGIDNDHLNLGSTYDSNSNRVVIVYRGPSDYAWAVVGSVSGTTITFGTPVAVTSANTYYVKATFDSSNNKVVVTYSDASSGYHGHAIVGTVSGTSISFGTAVEFKDSTTAEQTITFDSNSNKVVIAYRVSNVLYAIVGTVSGTSISFGSEVAVVSTETQQHGSTFDTVNNKVVLVYRDQDDSGKGKAVVGTVSGTSISFGSAAEFGDSGNYFDGMSNGTVFDSSAGKVVIVYRHSNNVLHAVVGTVSGTSISFGTRVEIDSSVVVQSTAASYDSAAQRIVVTYGDGAASDTLVLNVGTVSGTSISFDGVTTLDSASSSGAGASANVYDVNAGTVVVAHRDGSDSNKGNAVATQVGYTNLTANNFVGISNAAYSNGATATIQISGAVDDAQSSLAIGTNYFVSDTGGVATSGSVFAGKAISATKLAVKYPAPGGLTLLSSVTDVSGASSIDLTGMSDGFGAYKLYISDFKPVSQGNVLLQIFDDGTIQTGSNLYFWRTGILQGSFNTYNDTSDGHIELVTSTTPQGPFTGEIFISRSKVNNHGFNWSLSAGSGTSGNDARVFFGSGWFYTTDPTHGTERFNMTGIRLKMASGNVQARHVALYGVS